MSEQMNQAIQQALQELEKFQPVATSLVSYQSNGRVILLGGESELNRCGPFDDPLTVTRLSTRKSEHSLGQTGIIDITGQAVEIKGYLGKFEVLLPEARPGEVRKFEADIIVDLNKQAILQRELLPPGYLHEDITALKPQELQHKVLEMTGAFEKPKFFNYNAALCAHGRNGQTVCTRCIDACPAEAITSLVETIQVEPHLCQGGGTCAAVCPSGAIKYAYPKLSDSGNSLRKMLQVFHQQGGDQAVIVFHSTQQSAQALLDKDPQILPVVVEELASVGMDLALSALVYGAAQVVLLADDQVPQTSLEHLNQQVDWLQSMLSGLGLDPLRVTIVEALADIKRVEARWEINAALYTMPDNKRAALFQAIDHLYQQVEKTCDMVTLPDAAPFGEAVIDETRCTLCMACIGSCPGNALQDGSNRELPEVFFIESNCIQCGTCTQTCPENAISISPRIIFDREKRNRSRMLCQDSPYACISCGKAFAPTSVIQSMSHKLKDHYMFNTTRSMDRLKMCDNCRVADIAQDPQALNRHLDPLN